VRLLAETLENFCNFSHERIFVLVSSENESKKASLPEPTVENIVNYIQKVGKQCGSNDIVLFFFSGHGALGSEMESVLLTKKTNISSDDLISNTGLRVSELAKLMDKHFPHVKHRLIILDCCRNVAFTSRENQQAGQDFVSSAESGLRREVSSTLLFSCKKGEKSYEGLLSRPKGLSELRHSPEEEGKPGEEKEMQSYFTHELVKGLMGLAANEEGQVTTQSLCNYVCKTVPEEVKRKVGEDQHPYYILSGVADLARYRGVLRVQTRTEDGACISLRVKVGSSEGETLSDPAVGVDFPVDLGRRVTIGLSGQDADRWEVRKICAAEGVEVHFEPGTAPEVKTTSLEPKLIVLTVGERITHGWVSIDCRNIESPHSLCPARFRFSDGRAVIGGEKIRMPVGEKLEVTLDDAQYEPLQEKTVSVEVTRECAKRPCELRYYVRPATGVVKVRCINKATGKPVQTYVKISCRQDPLEVGQEGRDIQAPIGEWVIRLADARYRADSVSVQIRKERPCEAVLLVTVPDEHPTPPTPQLLGQVCAHCIDVETGQSVQLPVLINGNHVLSGISFYVPAESPIKVDMQDPWWEAVQPVECVVKEGEKKDLNLQIRRKVATFRLTTTPVAARVELSYLKRFGEPEPARSIFTVSPPRAGQATEVKLPYGSYSIAVKTEGYEPMEDTPREIEVAGDKSLNISLVPTKREVGIVFLRTDPPGAKVSSLVCEEGRVPKDVVREALARIGFRTDGDPLMLPYGTYRLTLKMDQYLPETRTIRFTPSGAKTSDGAPWPAQPIVMRPKTGTLLLEGMVAGSEWSLIGISGPATRQQQLAGYVSDNPKVRLDSIACGTYALRVTCRNRRTYAKTVRVDDKKPKTVKVFQPVVGTLIKLPPLTIPSEHW